jgi:hypothetical protein
MNNSKKNFAVGILAASICTTAVGAEAEKVRNHHCLEKAEQLALVAASTTNQKAILVQSQQLSGYPEIFGENIADWFAVVVRNELLKRTIIFQVRTISAQCELSSFEVAKTISE